MCVCCCCFWGVAAALLQFAIANANQRTVRSRKLFAEWAIRLWGGSGLLYISHAVYHVFFSQIFNYFSRFFRMLALFSLYDGWLAGWHFV